MDKKEQSDNPFTGLQLWKVVGVFALVYAAVQFATAIIREGTSYLISLINAGENLRVFVGSTISNAAIIAAILYITAPVIRAVLQKPGLESMYPRVKNWCKDMLMGIGISTVVLLIIFLIEFAFGWISIAGFALKGKTVDAWLRAIWLALLVNLTMAVGEEVLYRGLLLQGIKEAWDDRGALFISAIIFGGSHVISAGVEDSNWLQLIPLMALPGVVFGWAYLKSGNLWLATGLNFAWNLIQHDILNLTGKTSGNTHLGLLTNVSGPKWAAGAVYGIEAGAAGILALVLIAIGIWWRTKLENDREKN